MFLSAYIGAPPTIGFSPAIAAVPAVSAIMLSDVLNMFVSPVSLYVAGQDSPDRAELYLPGSHEVTQPKRDSFHARAFSWKFFELFCHIKRLGSSQQQAQIEETCPAANTSPVGSPVGEPPAGSS